MIIPIAITSFFIGGILGLFGGNIITRWAWRDRE